MSAFIIHWNSGTIVNASTGDLDAARAGGSTTLGADADVSLTIIGMGSGSTATTVSSSFDALTESGSTGPAGLTLTSINYTASGEDTYVEQDTTNTQILAGGVTLTVGVTLTRGSNLSMMGVNVGGSVSAGQSVSLSGSITCFLGSTATTQGTDTWLLTEQGSYSNHSLNLSNVNYGQSGSATDTSQSSSYVSVTLGSIDIGSTSAALL